MHHQSLSATEHYFHIESRWENLAQIFNTIWQVEQTWKQIHCTSFTVYNAETADPLNLKCVISEMDNTFDTDIAYYFQALEINHVLFQRC